MTLFDLIQKGLTVTNYYCDEIPLRIKYSASNSEPDLLAKVMLRKIMFGGGGEIGDTFLETAILF